jgi:hypothetical protein
MTITEAPGAAREANEIEVLLREAKRRSRRRRLALAGRVLFATVLAVALLIATIVAIGSRAPTNSPHTSPGPSIPVGALATVDRLGGGSSIWVVDMLSTSDGFAIAGRPGRHYPAFLVATSTGGRTWHVRSRLPYSFTGNSFWMPSLVFLNDRVGYTQSGIPEQGASDRDVFVTIDGGLQWRPLRLGGVIPTVAGDNLLAGSVNENYQVANGVLSLVALRCTETELLQGGSVCPSVLEQFKVGAVRPFATWQIPAVGDQLPGGRVPSDRLLAAVSARTVIVAEGDLEGWSPLLISKTGGRSWATWPTPCGSLRVGAFVLQLPIQELHLFASNWWVLDCWQDQGMSQGAIVVSATNNRGRSWRLLSEGSAGANAGGIPNVGTIGDDQQTLWASNDGRVLWAWDSIRGWFSESTDGGRDWTALRVASGEGGPPTVDLAPVGPRGAFLVVQGEAFATTNGINWRHLRLLPVS